MRVVFAGTPEVALPSLEALVASSHEVVAVVTRPDAPAGRGRHLEPSPVRRRARELGIPVLTPGSAKDPGFLAELTRIGPDLVAVVAYGDIISQAGLDIPVHGWVNLHFSILPAWRGAAPVQHAIMAGDELTGATTFRIERSMDTGPVFGVMTEQIRCDDTAGDLLDRLAVGGASLLVATVDGIETGALVAKPQPAEGVSLAPKVRVEDARVRWDRSAMLVDRLVRGCTPAPGAWTTFRGERLRLGPVAVVAPGGLPAEGRLTPGTLLVTKRMVFVGTATDAVRLGMVQAQGKRPMPAADWARGTRIDAGERFGDE
ncbi:MAG: methionyl-tRNA formyltransferase [Intrasporangium sp.]|uniref:methionyl-tRNA formyltransferase n=1 Tax=Intrasporangium sp. TaxID=1925024 RepID=UPI00264856B3|nr:methionyl-tRNA formyltransferase [Intrasporangium sp.]MDN5794137.1 methionyl-tRNA formyltransferase [Intrasporangium sp.]